MGLLVESAADLADKDIAAAKRELRISQLTAILVKAMRETGRARVVLGRGREMGIGFSYLGGSYRGGDALVTGDKAQDERNLYHACRNLAALSVGSPMPPVEINPTTQGADYDH